ncbi:hypothetical protein GTP05_02800 [Lactococcus lactis]|nr:hypothetical protein [Lactococcus lactis]NEX49348.1 hypothetical protein [Lactococcus lactis]
MAESLAWDFQQIDGIASLFDRELEVLESDPPNAELYFSFGIEIHVKPVEDDKFNQSLETNTGIKEN